jgi:hypothetical protein
MGSQTEEPSSAVSLGDGLSFKLSLPETLTVLDHEECHSIVATLGADARVHVVKDMIDSGALAVGVLLGSVKTEHHLTGKATDFTHYFMRSCRRGGLKERKRDNRTMSVHTHAGPWCW